MSNTNSPCLDCKKRYCGCHSTCKDYKDWRKLHEEEVCREKKERLEQTLMAAYISDAVTHKKKAKNLRPKMKDD